MDSSRVIMTSPGPTTGTRGEGGGIAVERVINFHNDFPPEFREFHRFPLRQRNRGPSAQSSVSVPPEPVPCGTLRIGFLLRWRPPHQRVVEANPRREAADRQCMFLERASVFLSGVSSSETQPETEIGGRRDAIALLFSDCCGDPADYEG